MAWDGDASNGGETNYPSPFREARGPRGFSVTFFRFFFGIPQGRGKRTTEMVNVDVWAVFLSSDEKLFFLCVLISSI